MLKSRHGIPRPTMPPVGVDMAQEGRTARSLFYPVTVAYTGYAVGVVALGLLQDHRTAVLSVATAVVCWTLVEYLVHRYVLHGRFPDGPGWLRHLLHRLFDPSHGDHHLRLWDGRHINGSYDTVPLAVVLASSSFLAPLATLPVFVATLLQCYVVEEWSHYSVHFHRFRWRYFVHIRKHHLYHHSARGRDLVFRTVERTLGRPLRHPDPASRPRAALPWARPSNRR